MSFKGTHLRNVVRSSVLSENIYPGMDLYLFMLYLLRFLAKQIHLTTIRSVSSVRIDYIHAIQMASLSSNRDIQRR